MSSSVWRAHLVGGRSMQLLGFTAEGTLIYTILVATGGAALLAYIRRTMFEFSWTGQHTATSRQQW